MKKRLWFVMVFILIGSLVLLQVIFIDKSEEQKRERTFSDLSKLPPTRVASSYFGTLALGPFKSVAVDLLWLIYLDAYDKKRFEDAAEAAELLFNLQSQNEEILVHLSWDFAYNIPIQPGDPENDKILWKWYRYGLLKARQAIDIRWDSPYIKKWLAWMLYHKVTWMIRHLNTFLINNFERDIDLKQRLLDGILHKDDAKFTTIFEVSERWFAVARQQVKEISREGYYKAPAGLYITDELLDNYIRSCIYANTILAYRRCNLQKAIRELERAKDHMGYMINAYGDIDERYKNFLEFFSALQEVFKWEAGQNHIPRCMVKNCEVCLQKIIKFERMVKEFGRRADESLYMHQALSVVKVRFTGDLYEFNDCVYMAQYMRKNRQYSASLSPFDYDKDYFCIYISPPLHAHEEFKPKDVKFSFENKSGVELSLEVTHKGKVLHSSKVRPGELINVRFRADTHGEYFVLVWVVSPENKKLKYDYIITSLEY
jgi:hypothetical protein